MEKDYITVSELNKYIKEILDDNYILQNVYLKGEISNFKAHTSGHYYFSLKDETSRIKAIMFKMQAVKTIFTPIDGMNVLIRGRISLYEANGEYQIYVEEMIESGVGNLYIAFEQLKKKLEKEGLFDQKYKKKIPRMPKKIGIITAPTGAAIRDILSTLKRRYPVAETILFPAIVQGSDGAMSIVEQIKKANEYDIDVIILGRGGGSIEDLWNFNEEIVARAIFDSKIPIISAVGHEIDYCISDFVADLRAPTPTGAAEMAVPNIVDIINYLSQVNIRINNAIENKIKIIKTNLLNITKSRILLNPKIMYEIKLQKLINISDNLQKSIDNILNSYNSRLINICSAYVVNNPKKIYEKYSNKLELLIEKCEVLNPMSALKRGYGIIKQDNKVVSDINDIKPDDIVDISLKNGIIVSKVIEVKGD